MNKVGSVIVGKESPATWLVRLFTTEIARVGAELLIRCLVVSVTLTAGAVLVTVFRVEDTSHLQLFLLASVLAVVAVWVSHKIETKS